MPSRRGVRATPRALGRIAAGALLTAAISTAPAAAATEQPLPVPAPQLNAMQAFPAPHAKPARLDGRLATLSRARAAGRDVRAGARRSGLEVSRDRLRISVEGRDAATTLAALRRAGATEISQAGRRVEALVTTASIDVLAGDPAIHHVAAAPEGVPLAVAGEGVGASGAPAWHAGGMTGAGVTVAVIDGGFAGLAAAKASGDLPATTVNHDACAGGFDTRSEHGTGVAEIVHEMAPDAKLVLICASGVAGLTTAKNFAIAQGASIVNHSIAFFNTARGDGQGAAGTPDAIVADARAQGVLWVSSAGNSGNKHWSGSFVGGGNGTFHQWVAGDQINAINVAGGATGCAFLRWDDWPSSTRDYDLYIATTGGTIVSGDQGEGAQTGTQPPTEIACVENTGPTATFGIAIRRYSATTTPRMDVFVGSGVGSFERNVPDGSIVDPAASPSALAAGAICWQNNAIEAYSSRGPTIDARVKPEIAGQDSQSNFTFGPFSTCGTSGFTGTSAAAPSVAGAAALVKEALPGSTAAQLSASLQARATDLGAAGIDNTFGAGGLALGAIPRPSTAAAATTATAPSATTAAATTAAAPPPAPPITSGSSSSPRLADARMSCRRGSPKRRRIGCRFTNAGAVRSVKLRATRRGRTYATVTRTMTSSRRLTITLPRRARSGRYTITATLRNGAGATRTLRVSVRI